MSLPADTTTWATVYSRLLSGQDLSAQQTRHVMTDMLQGEASPVQMAAFLIAMRLKGETVEELAAIVSTLLDFSLPLPLNIDVLDTCGTGASRQRHEGALNVSTIASFVIAGAGVAVCKHGGRAATATSSSGDLLAALGVNIELDPASVARCIHTAGMGFCFAPRFHPALRHAVPVRRELGIPTLFNFVAPLANPARPTMQLLGVSDPTMAARMAKVLSTRGVKRALLVWGHDGLDELTLTTTSSVLDVSPDGTRHYDVDPRELGLSLATPSELLGGTATDNAAIARRVLNGAPGPHRDVILLNAAGGLVAAGTAPDLATGLELAADSLNSGRAARVLRRLIATSTTSS